ncbi:YitT family protein [Paenarthrobacter sp. NPDC092416]|uniref:membrane protein YczE n=1 Tax=Paenarthrobacter sp. NPDC092416 TaxID=3364386 RepID=UPI0038004923
MRFLTSHRLGPRLVRLYIGLMGCGLGIAGTLKSELGVSPWDVLGQGVAKASGLGFGAATVVVSSLVLLLWIPLRQRPGLGTVSNAALVGWFVDISSTLVPAAGQIPLWRPAAQALLLGAGIILFAFSCALYIGANLKPGPRDGLMTGLVAITGKPVWMIRTALELLVVTTGWLLGGTVGIGAAAFAFSIGPLIQLALRILGVHIGPATPAGSVSPSGGDEK